MRQDPQSWLEKCWKVLFEGNIEAIDLALQLGEATNNYMHMFDLTVHAAWFVDRDREARIDRFQQALDWSALVEADLSELEDLQRAHDQLLVQEGQMSAAEWTELHGLGDSSPLGATERRLAIASGDIGLTLQTLNSRLALRDRLGAGEVIVTGANAASIDTAARFRILGAFDQIFTGSSFKKREAKELLEYLKKAARISQLALTSTPVQDIDRQWALLDDRLHEYQFRVGAELGDPNAMVRAMFVTVPAIEPIVMGQAHGLEFDLSAIDHSELEPQEIYLALSEQRHALSEAGNPIPALLERALLDNAQQYLEGLVATQLATHSNAHWLDNATTEIDSLDMQPSDLVLAAENLQTEVADGVIHQVLSRTGEVTTTANDSATYSDKQKSQLRNRLKSLGNHYRKQCSSSDVQRISEHRKKATVYQPDAARITDSHNRVKEPLEELKQAHRAGVELYDNAIEAIGRLHSGEVSQNNEAQRIVGLLDEAEGAGIRPTATFSVFNALIRTGDLDRAVETLVSSQRDPKPVAEFVCAYAGDRTVTEMTDALQFLRAQGWVDIQAIKEVRPIVQRMNRLVAPSQFELALDVMVETVQSNAAGQQDVEWTQAVRSEGHMTIANSYLAIGAVTPVEAQRTLLDSTLEQVELAADAADAGTHSKKRLRLTLEAIHKTFSFDNSRVERVASALGVELGSTKRSLPGIE